MINNSFVETGTFYWIFLMKIKFKRTAFDFLMEIFYKMYCFYYYYWSL